MAFELSQLSPNVFAIKELDDRDLHPLSYLIVGTERVILIDTGCGCGNMYSFVRGLDFSGQLKILVINTHNHREQIGGNWRFSTTGKFGLGLQVEDLCASRRHKYYTRLMDSSWHWEVYTYKVTRWLSDGEVVPLGDNDSIQMYFEIFWTPGHTPDSLVVWYARGRRLFLGDLFYRFDDILLSYPHVDIRAYETSVRRILDLVNIHPERGELRFSAAKNDADERCLPLLKLYHRIDDAEGWRFETRDKAMKIVLGRDTVRKLNEAREKTQQNR